MLIVPFEHQTLICVIRKLTKINLSSLQARRSAIYQVKFAEFNLFYYLKSID